MFNFTSRYPAAIGILLIIVAFLLSYYSYKKPLLSMKRRYVLIAVRTAAIFLILLLFIEPSVTAVISDTREYTDVALIDDSRSIRLPGQDPQQIRSLLSKAGLAGEKLIVFPFSRHGVPLLRINSADSLNFNGFETDLAFTLKALRDAVPDLHINSITVISDGNFNSGGSPLYAARTFQCPVNTIITGDSAQQKDVVVKNVTHSEKSLTDTDTKLTARIRTFGLRNSLFTVTLLREGNEISSRNAEVTSDREDLTFDFIVRESRPGTVRYRISAGRTDGEVTFENNERDFLIEFFDNRTNLLFVSSGPGNDNPLFTETLKSLRNYNVTFRTQKSPDEFYEGPVDPKIYSELSAIILLGFPSERTGSELISSITEKSSLFGIPVVFFASRNTDYKKLARFEQVPISVSRSGPGEYFTTPRVVSSEAIFSKEFQAIITSSPQLVMNQSGIIPAPGSTVFMTGGSFAEPVMVSTVTARLRSTAFLCYGFWRWRLNPSKNNESIFQELLQTAVNRTVRTEKITKLKIYADKDIFDYTENASVAAEVFDENMGPILNAVVKCRIISRVTGQGQEIQLIPNDKKYTAVLPGLPPGDYSAEAEAELNGNFYSRDSCRFLIDTLRTEYLETKNSRAVLEELSNWTGGRSFSFTPETSLEEVISSSAEQNTQPELSTTRRFNFRENKFLLAAIIILFGTEWVIKKRNNIP